LDDQTCGFLVDFLDGVCHWFLRFCEIVFVIGHEAFANVEKEADQRRQELPEMEGEGRCVSDKGAVHRSRGLACH
jgi:hypothetical protein